MKPFCQIASVACLLILGGCAAYEGVYEPACIAYEGDRIELRNGKFYWEKFTDERKVDASGKLIQPFPDYPKQGSYDTFDNRIELLADNGTRMEDLYAYKRGRHLYLLTYEENSATLSGEKVPGCALRLRQD